MDKYSQGVCQDGAAILKDGQRMTVDEVVAELNESQRLREALEKIATLEDDDMPWARHTAKAALYFS